MQKKIIGLITTSFLFVGNILACTGIVHKAEDNSHVFARTMEFGADLISFDLLYVPQGIEYVSQANTKGNGGKWTTKYAHVGFSPFGLPLLADGLNEKGLACGAFYFPGWAEYQTVTAEEEKNAISNLDLPSWILGNFSTVNEVRDALKNTKIVGVVFGPWGIVPPLHYVVADQSGDQAVIEYVGGKLSLYEMPLGTITNAPTYDWHMLNARNYIGLRALNSPSVKIQNSELSQFGQGSGAIGLPGDFTPPSRFIRAAFLNTVVLPAKDGPANIKRAFKILNQFDIPKGAVKEKQPNGKEIVEETQWTSASDLTNLKYYFHTAENRTIQVVDLKKLDFNAKKFKLIPTNTPESFIDLTSNFIEDKEDTAR